MDDQEILTLIREGSQESGFQSLVDAYKTMVYNIIYQMVNNPSLAEDLSQETFLRVWRGLPHFRAQAKLSTWIYRIAMNVTYSELKLKKHRVAKLSIDGNPQTEEVPTLVDDSMSPEEQLEREEASKRVRQALTRLPDRYRMALNLYYFVGKSYEEVAEVMEIPLGTVKTYIHRGKGQLAEILHPTEVPE